MLIDEYCLNYIARDRLSRIFDVEFLVDECGYVGLGWLRIFLEDYSRKFDYECVPVSWVKTKFS